MDVGWLVDGIPTPKAERAPGETGTHEGSFINRYV